MSTKTIVSQATSSLIAVVLVAVLVLLWNWASEGGLVRALGGVTEQELKEPEWRDALRGERGEPGEKGDAGEKGDPGEKGDRGAQGDAASFPVGAVVAFDLPDGCPTDEGWQDYDKGAGRFIAGMGRHASGDRYGNPVEELTLGQVGGHRTHRLTEPELPAHSHKYEFSSGSARRAEGDFTPIEFGAKDRIRLTGSTGKNAPHNNLPPFIALRYCIYVGG